MFNTPLMKSRYNLPIESVASERARKRLEQHLSRGEEETQNIVDYVMNMTIHDALVAPKGLEFSWDKGLHIDLAGKAQLTVHRHALGQFCGTFRYPASYASRLAQGVTNTPSALCHAKLVDDLNWHASNARMKDRKGNPAKYLCRYVDGELRGFLSRSFKRHLASRPLLTSFLNSCDQAGLRPIGGYASPIRVNLECALPYAFEPFPGEFLGVGVAWTNSDFGGGRMKVSMFMQRIGGKASAILSDAISAVHIGAVIEEDDVELSAETNNAEIRAQRSAINDAVQSQLTPDNVNKLIEVVRLAHEEEMSWQKIKGEFGRLLQTKELEAIKGALADPDGGFFQELPPLAHDEDDEPVPTRWWASSIVGQLADKEVDAERKKDLQELSGKILGASRAVKKVRTKKAA